MTSRRLLTPIGRVMLDAADYIEEHGWCQGRLMSIDGRVCAVGALHQVVGWPCMTPAAVEATTQLCCDATNHFMWVNRIVDIPKWNDWPGRMPEEVIAAFRRAALTPMGEEAKEAVAA